MTDRSAHPIHPHQVGRDATAVTWRRWQQSYFPLLPQGDASSTYNAVGLNKGEVQPLTKQI